MFFNEEFFIQKLINYMYAVNNKSTIVIILILLFSFSVKRHVTRREKQWSLYWNLTKFSKAAWESQKGEILPSRQP